MSRLRRVVGLEEPQETRFFLLITAWAFVLGIVYWVVSQEPAGTGLLAGLALAGAAMSAWLVRGARSGRVRRHADERPLVPESEADVPGAGTAGIDRPFHDEEGRLPEPSLAPFALGLGIALIATGPVFGLAPVMVGVIALLWGAWQWLAAARAEHEELGAPVAEVDALEASAAAERPSSSIVPDAPHTKTERRP